MIDHVNVSEDDTFIDLGSGVGQVVLQIAASTPCKMAWGIERADCPSRYAEVLYRVVYSEPRFLQFNATTFTGTVLLLYCT